MIEKKTEENKFLILRKVINRIRKRFYDKVTEFNFMKICTLAVIPGYLGILLISVIVAYAFGGTSQGPGTYYIWTNWISDLGSFSYTPAPILYDLAAILAGILTIPFTFYIEKLLIPLPQKPEDYNKITRLRYRLGSYAFLMSIIGNIGYVLVGIFSEDRNTFGIMHGLASVLAFGGFTLGALFYGMIIILYDVKIPKWIGVYGVVGPLFALLLEGALPSIVDPALGPLFEWVLLFAILGWIIPLSLTILMKEELHI